MEKEIQIPDGFEAKIEGNKVIFVPKESYDEKVRKTLLRCCDDWDKGQFGCMKKEDVPSIRAYIERMKDSDKAISAIEKIDKYIDSHTANAHDMDDSNPDKKYYSGVDDTLSDIAGILTDCYTNFDGKKWIREKDYHDQLDAQYAQGFEDGRKEQKPAELSEEDEKWFKEIELMALYFSNNTNYREKFFNWLNSLHERFNSQSKQEWSDEDKKMMNEIITIMDGGKVTSGTYLSEYVVWLKSLPERFNPHWKPSEEQMGVLNYAYCNAEKLITEIDLEKEILDWIGDEGSCKNGKWTWYECNKMIRHFYELGLKATKEE